MQRVKKYVKYTDEEIALLRRYYPKYGTEGVLKMMRIKNMPLRTHKAIKAACMRMGIKSETSGRFQPGHTPFNKGVKMPAEVFEKVRKTCFKPGHMSINTMPLGSLRKGTDGYWYVKIAMPNKWCRQHALLWEQHNGAIPAGSVIVFKDHNPDNVTIENLECITRGELARRNANLPKRSESMRAAWQRRRELAKAERRQQLRQMYGSLSAAMAAGETL